MGVTVNDYIDDYLGGEAASEYFEMTNEEKSEYSSHAMKIVNSLFDYIPQISLVEMTDGEPEVDFSYDLIFHSRKCGKKYIRLTQKNDFIEGLIPQRLMKVCGYRKSTKVYKSYTPAYESLNEDIYERISKKDRFAELTDKQRERDVYDPINTLVQNTLMNKRKCAGKLYAHLVTEDEAIIVRVFKNKYKIYDFGTELEADVSSMSVKKVSADELAIKFTNGVKVDLTLRNNSIDISANISLKYNIKIRNLDELFMMRENMLTAQSDRVI